MYSYLPWSDHRTECPFPENTAKSNEVKVERRVLFPALFRLFEQPEIKVSALPRGGLNTRPRPAPEDFTQREGLLVQPLSC